MSSLMFPNISFPKLLDLQEQVRSSERTTLIFFQTVHIQWAALFIMAETGNFLSVCRSLKQPQSFQHLKKVFLNVVFPQLQAERLVKY